MDQSDHEVHWLEILRAIDPDRWRTIIQIEEEIARARLEVRPVQGYGIAIQLIEWKEQGLVIEQRSYPQPTDWVFCQRWKRTWLGTGVLNHPEFVIPPLMEME